MEKPKSLSQKHHHSKKLSQDEQELEQKVEKKQKKSETNFESIKALTK